ncbi:MAG: WxcM-like domain-containing protein [Lachnospiraceae bacterium]|nr:WxcM-like domain-containing protein [Lachnospiraceae bacterium]
MNVEWFYAQQHGDARGQLVSLEENKEIPFNIKRVYYIYDTLEGVRRGFHAHKELKQLLICIHGTCKVLLDDGYDKEIVSLDEPNKGIFIQSNIWREMYDFSPDAVLLVLASEIYDESDYIRDYEQFIRYVKGN